MDEIERSYLQGKVIRLESSYKELYRMLLYCVLMSGGKIYLHNSLGLTDTSKYRLRFHDDVDKLSTVIEAEKIA